MDNLSQERFSNQVKGFRMLGGISKAGTWCMLILHSPDAIKKKPEYAICVMDFFVFRPFYADIGILCNRYVTIWFKFLG